MRATVLLFILCVVIPTVHASDGVFEINADCAVFGCFDGDTSGLPVTISNPGSYRLTGNLSINSVNQTAISVDTDNVSIDLNGFALIGIVTCSGGTLSCSDSGSGVGIDAETRANISIRNGTVSGMGNVGIIVGRYARLEEITVSQNGGGGIEAFAPGAVLHRITASENGGTGIGLGFGLSYVMDSTAFNNAAQGVMGGFCGNVLMAGNLNNSCTAIAPNRCDTATQCD
ncbi:MAG: hypothetical protein AAF446_02220 [Pseudomonadota bacterium]